VIALVDGGRCHAGHRPSPALPGVDGRFLAAHDPQALSAGPIRVRMGVPTRRPHVGREGYVGEDVHLAARIAAGVDG
jgi:hypothetical protein